MNVNIIYFYITSGKTKIPDHLFDSLYQTHLLNESLTIYLITNSKWEEYIKKRVEKMETEKKINLKIVDCETLSETETIKRYEKVVKNYERNKFRDGFWIYTTTRFLYIAELMKQQNIENVFHIESDVMIYENLEKIYTNLKSLEMTDKIVAVQDAPKRAVCSIVYLPTIKEANKYAEYITKSVEMSSTPLNDMDFMGMYKDKNEFPDCPLHKNSKKLGVYDANGIGQYLGGIDFRNIVPNQITNKYINPTKGFINETATFKPNTADFFKGVIKDSKLKKYYIKDKKEEQIKDLQVIHVHSKQLYLYSSIFDINYNDIITGDRIIALCDFVITDKIQFSYNINLTKHNSNIFLVKDFKKINYELLNEKILQHNNETGNENIKLFIFIDNMKEFGEYILPNLSNKLKYVIYSHNGDYAFDSRFKSIIEDSKVKHIYAQNLNINLDINENEKTTMIPIGLARDMFLHGDLEKLYEVMTKNYYLKKTKELYINFNENTYSTRKVIMNVIKKSGKWEIKSAKSYKEYLEEMSEYRFCLCIRGNGIDTHRLWEAVYLGVVPVIVYEKSLDNYLRELDKLQIKYVLIDSVNFFIENDKKFFTKELYKNKKMNDIEKIKISSF